MESTYYPTTLVSMSSRSCRNYSSDYRDISPKCAIYRPADTSRLAGASTQYLRNDAPCPWAKIAPHLSCAQVRHPTARNRTLQCYPRTQNTWYRPRRDRNSGMRSQSCSRNGRDCNYRRSRYHLRRRPRSRQQGNQVNCWQRGIAGCQG